MDVKEKVKHPSFYLYLCSLLIKSRKLVGHAGFEPALFFIPNEVPCQARRMTVNFI